MQLKQAWQSEAKTAALLVLFALIFGLFIELPLEAVGFALLVYLARSIVNFKRFASWFEERGTHYPPEISGIFGTLGQIAFSQFKTLEAHNERLSHLVDELTRSIQALPDSIVILNEKYHIRWGNEAATRLLGIAPEDAEQSLENLLRHPEFIRYLRKEDFSKSLTIPAPFDPNLALLVRILPHAGNYHVLLARDITENLRLEKMRRDFISNVSHELRTPITVLKGHLEQLSVKGLSIDERFSRSYKVMDTQVDHLNTLVEDLLFLSRIESTGHAADAQWVDMWQLILNIHEEAQLLSEAQHRITLNGEKSLRMWANHQELRIAFSNLVRNAVKYSPDGGEIGLIWQRTERGAVFRVIDSGIGIEAVYIPRLTERFYRVGTGRSRDSGGTGLGLAIVKHILNHYNAHLEISSVPDAGSIFSCHFPAELITTDNGEAPES